MKMCLICLSVILALGTASPAQVAAKHAGDKNHHFIVPLMRDGKPTARGLDKYEIVSGNPDVPGAPFVIRIHNYDNQVLPPHWHPEDEHIVVVKGTWYISEGDTWDRSSMREMNVGDYIFVPKNMRHFGLAKGELVVQIHGVGPFKTVLADPWLNLTDPKADGKFKFKEGERVRSKRGEGIIRWGVYSEKNRITQYAVENKDGDAFFEFEGELERVK
jgi:cupin superfamily acireductone dioxygenase involved in methionine salvage